MNESNLWKGGEVVGAAHFRKLLLSLFHQQPHNVKAFYTRYEVNKNKSRKTTTTTTKTLTHSKEDETCRRNFVSFIINMCIAYTAKPWLTIFLRVPKQWMDSAFHWYTSPYRYYHTEAFKHTHTWTCSCFFGHGYGTSSSKRWINVDNCDNTFPANDSNRKTERKWWQKCMNSDKYFCPYSFSCWLILYLFCVSNAFFFNPYNSINCSYRK